MPRKPKYDDPRIHDRARRVWYNWRCLHMTKAAAWRTAVPQSRVRDLTSAANTDIQWYQETFGDEVPAALEAAGLGLPAIAKMLQEAIVASKAHRVGNKDDGYELEYSPDWNARIKAGELLMKAHGWLQRDGSSTQQNLVMSDTINILITPKKDESLDEWEKRIDDFEREQQGT